MLLLVRDKHPYTLILSRHMARYWIELAIQILQPYEGILLKYVLSTCLLVKQGFGKIVFVWPGHSISRYAVAAKSSAWE